MTNVCKLVYYTDCSDENKQKLQSLKEFIEASFRGIFLVKVWDEGSVIGLFQVK